LEQQYFSDLDSIQVALLGWFEREGRDLPWRRIRDPYRIMVSEIMLQQTQVDRVIPKYEAFLLLFPRLEDLAEAATSEVIKAWAGLGYNRRAVNLQRAARAVLDEHGGKFPQDVATLRSLPGIGAYTSGAIACFAFEQDVAFLDTNIRRVVQRLFVGGELPSDGGAAYEAFLVELARKAIPEGQGWAWNQAIMELGALVCTSASPQCWRCPLAAFCQDMRLRREADEQLFANPMFDGLAPTPAPAKRTRRAIAEKREESFVGSRRFYRGRIVDALRQLGANEHMSVLALGPLVKEDFSELDSDWLRDLLLGLDRDGLVSFDGALVRLPD
jgi:A/G-specific adenine glycosylase